MFSFGGKRTLFKKEQPGHAETRRSVRYGWGRPFIIGPGDEKRQRSERSRALKGLGRGWGVIGELMGPPDRLFLLLHVAGVKIYNSLCSNEPVSR